MFFPLGYDECNSVRNVKLRPHVFYVVVHMLDKWDKLNPYNIFFLTFSEMFWPYSVAFSLAMVEYSTAFPATLLAPSDSNDQP